VAQVMPAKVLDPGSPESVPSCMVIYSWSLASTPSVIPAVTNFLRDSNFLRVLQTPEIDPYAQFEFYGANERRPLGRRAFWAGGKLHIYSAAGMPDGWCRHASAFPVMCPVSSDSAISVSDPQPVPKRFGPRP
jgi:hypothetical protein